MVDQWVKRDRLAHRLTVWKGRRRVWPSCMRAKYLVKGWDDVRRYARLDGAARCHASGPVARTPSAVKRAALARYPLRMAPIRPAPNWQKLIMVGSSAIVSKRRYDSEKDRRMTTTQLTGRKR